MGDVGEGVARPYRTMLEEAFEMESTERIKFFQKKKESMSIESWGLLMTVAQHQLRKDARYTGVLLDLGKVDAQE